MVAIYPTTALKDRQREVKQAANAGVVHITENGHGAYVFASEEVFQREIDRAVDDALYEARLFDALRESRADAAAGRVYESREDLLAAVEQMRAHA